jgi:two-component system KDP operon response regulator KdpE
MTQPRILVVDDEPEILGILQEALSDAGYEVVTASNAIEAEMLIDDPAVRLALIDVGMHGLRLARQALAAGKSFILMSGAPVVVEMGEFGEVLRKPFKLSQLLRLVDRWASDGELRVARSGALGGAGVLVR